MEWYVGRRAGERVRPRPAGGRARIGEGGGGHPLPRRRPGAPPLRAARRDRRHGRAARGVRDRRRDCGRRRRRHPGSPTPGRRGRRGPTPRRRRRCAGELHPVPTRGSPWCTVEDRDAGGAREGARDVIGVDLASVTGTGPDGRIRVADVERAAEPLPQRAAGEEALRGVRKTMAERMALSRARVVPVTVTEQHADIGDDFARPPAALPRLVQRRTSTTGRERRHRPQRVVSTATIRRGGSSPGRRTVRRIGKRPTARGRALYPVRCCAISGAIREPDRGCVARRRSRRARRRRRPLGEGHAELDEEATITTEQLRDALTTRNEHPGRGAATRSSILEEEHGTRPRHAGGFGTGGRGQPATRGSSLDLRTTSGADTGAQSSRVPRRGQGEDSGTTHVNQATSRAGEPRETEPKPDFPVRRHARPDGWYIDEDGYAGAPAAEMRGRSRYSHRPAVPGDMELGHVPSMRSARPSTPGPAAVPTPPPTVAGGGSPIGRRTSAKRDHAAVLVPSYGENPAHTCGEASSIHEP